METAANAEVRRAVRARREEFLATLFRLLRQPSISTQGVGVRECADLLKTVFDEHGFPARLLPTAGYPVVYAERRVAHDATTVLIYGHYDVQPPEPLDAWRSPPFEPTIRDGRIYARGAGDNKGQFLAHLLAVALLEALGRPPRLSLKFLIEGEEENSSPNLPAFVEAHGALLAADLLFAADGPMHLANRPIVFFGLRGTLKMEVEAVGPNRDLHSGNFGGPVPNPIWMLVDLLGTMRSADGRVAVDGFYERVVPPTAYERAVMERIPFDERAVKADLGLREFAGPAGLSYFEKLMFQPTLNITGIGGGYTAKGAKSVIPSRAVAKLETRLVSAQEPSEIFDKIARHVHRHAPYVGIRNLGGTRPSKTSPELAVSRIITQAVADAYGVEPVVMPVLGASGPNYLFTDVLRMPAVWVTYGPHDENNHAPNENMTIEAFLDGICASALVLERLAAAPRVALASFAP